MKDNKNKFPPILFIPLCLSIGMIIGVMFSSSGNIPVGLSIGMGVGGIIGGIMSIVLTLLKKNK